MCGLGFSNGGWGGGKEGEGEGGGEGKGKGKGEGGRGMGREGSLADLLGARCAGSLMGERLLKWFAGDWCN